MSIHDTNILGIGRAVAVALVTAGAKTYAVSRTQNSLDELKSEVSALQCSIHTRGIQQLSLDSFNTPYNISMDIDVFKFVHGC